MARVFLIVALLGALVTGYFTFANNGKKKEAQAAQKQSEASLATANSKLKKSDADLKAAQSSLDEAKKNLDEAASRAQTAQAALTAAQQKAADLESRVSAAEQKANTAQAEADKAKQDLGAQADQTKALQTKADALDKDKRQLADDLAAQKAEVARLNDVMARTKTGTLPPGINGKVVSVNRNWNFVVLNVGEKDGVVENGELTVSRTVQGRKQVIGKVKVVSTEANTAVADIEVSTLQGQIQNGDDALN